MKTFSAIATTTPPENSSIKKEDIWGWSPLIIALVAIAVAYGVFKTKLATIESTIEKKEKLDKENRDSDKETRKEDKEQIKELLENNNKILLANLTGEFGAIKGEFGSIKQMVYTLGKLLKNQEQTINGQRERLLKVEQNVNDVLGIYGSRNRDNPPSNPPDYSNR